MGGCPLSQNGMYKAQKTDIQLDQIKNSTVETLEQFAKLEKQKTKQFFKLKTLKLENKSTNNISTEQLLEQKKYLGSKCITYIVKNNFKMSYVGKGDDVRNSMISMNKKEYYNIDQYSAHHISVEEEENYLNKLKSNILFNHFDEKMLDFIIEESEGFQVEPGDYIYREGDEGNCFFLIKTGSIELTFKSTSQKPIVITSGDCFGELALLNSNIIRTETAKALTEVNFFALEGETFRLALDTFGENKLEQILYYINGNTWLCNLNPCIKVKLSMIVKKRLFKENEVINSAEDKTILNEMYLVKSGSFKYTSKNTKTRIIYPKDYLGEKNAILGLGNKNPFELKSMENSSCYVITKKMLEDIVGTNFKDVILYSIFKNSMMSNNFFKNIFLETQLEFLYKAFTLRVYNPAEEMYSVDGTKNKKAMIILEGLYGEKNKTLFYSQSGVVFGDEIICSNENLLSPIISIGETIVLEATWESIRSVLMTISKHSSLDVFRRANRLSHTGMFKFLHESLLIQLSQQMKKKKYSPEEVIVRENEPVDAFYLISKGRVKITENNKIIRELETGKGFGEISLLNDLNSPYSVIATDEVKCYILSKACFIQSLIDEKINDYVRKKMCLEDTNVTLNDLFEITKLGKGKYGTVHLVHNCISLYAIKSVKLTHSAKDISLGKYLVSEKKIMQSIDHPFIVKLVKTLKTETNCFFLMEYIHGKTLENYINNKTEKKSIQELKVYGASLFLVVDYLHKKLICHRDIKSSNIMIDQSGYLKLIDFGSAKVLKDFTYSVLGTPLCIAPEILGGKGYSFTCDYWSIGICLYFVYFGRYPFTEIDIMTLYQTIVDKNKKINFPKELEGSESVIFLTKILRKNPIERLCSLKHIQQDIFFHGFPWKEMKEMKLDMPYIPRTTSSNQSLNILNNKSQLYMKNHQSVSPNPLGQEEDYRGVYIQETIASSWYQWFEEFE